MVLEDFLHFLIYIMNDETCRLNSKVCKDLHTGSEETELSIKCHGVIEKVLINLLLGHYWVDVPQLKETMKNVLIHHSDVDDILHKVAIIDEKSKKVRIKEEYQNEIDPYIFYRTPAIQSDIVQNVGSRTKKDTKIDMVSGKYYNNLPCYLKAVQNKIFQSSLPKYLANFLHSFQNHTTLLLRPVLKLILLNLQVVEESLKDNHVDSLASNVQENYLSQEFSKKLSELQRNPDFKDCEQCIEKIQKIAETLSSKLQNGTTINTENKDTVGHEDHLALKKKLAHQRMQQLKEEFMKKQKMFMHKNTLHHNENGEEAKINGGEDLMETEDHGLTCQFCLDKINKGTDSYGTPVYVGFTNNLYDIEESATNLKKEEHPEKLVGNWWPTVSTCMHHYHEKCFQSYYKNSRKAPDSLGKLFANTFETYCSLCNTLCNAFMLEDRPQTTKRPNQEGNEQSLAEEENGQKSFSFVKNIEALLKDLQTKLRLQPNVIIEEESSIETKEIFRKGYNYFLETFHLAEKTSSLERMFLIYQGFIKEYVNHLEENGCIAPDVASLFTKIFSDKHFSGSEGSIAQKAALLTNFKPETLLNDVSFDLLVKFSMMSNQVGEADFIQEHLKILKEYVAFKVVQLVLYCKESNISLNETYLLYKEDEELKEDVLEALLFPVQKFVIAATLARSIVFGETKPNQKFLEALLDSEDAIGQYLDKLIRFAGLGDSFEKIIEESLQELLTKPTVIVASVSEMLAYDTSATPLSEPQTVKLAPKMVELPKTYTDFITIYFKNKCGQCKLYTPHMSTYICLICGEVICLAYCATSPQKRGNLNTHAKQCHLGSSMYLEIQRLSKAIVSWSKNSMLTGKDVYTDKLGQAIQNLINDPRSPLYSLDFDKFTLSEDFVQNTKQTLKQFNMAKDVFKLTKTSGFYYAEGNL